MLSKRFSRIDNLDLKPCWGEIPEEKQGALITSNLKDIGDHLSEREYDCIFGCWALCYINYNEVEDVLYTLQSILNE